MTKPVVPARPQLSYLWSHTCSSCAEFMWKCSPLARHSGMWGKLGLRAA